MKKSLFSYVFLIFLSIIFLSITFLAITFLPITFLPGSYATELDFVFTPLKISNRTAVETSTKLPVTDLEQAPLQGAVSNLHWYN